MPSKNVPINYFARDFASIKSALVEHAKRYYPDSFKDFNEAGFGSLMLDTVAYNGDILSFYLDYQANESFLDTAFEFQNILRHAKPLGFRFRENPSSYGVGTFFVQVPANDTGLGPDSRYIPTLKKGSIVVANNGNNFVLNEDVFFDQEDNEIVVSKVDPTTGAPTFYAIRAFGQIISGRFEETIIDVGDFQKFLRLEVPVDNVAEILLVEDSEGHEYYEVEYLSQDVVYRPVANRVNTDRNAPSILKPFTVPRRFIVEREEGAVYLQFGHGADTSQDNTSEQLADPSKVVLEVHGKDYFSDETFDPANLVNTDKFGIAPANTSLRVVLRANTNDNVNAGADSINSVAEAILEFEDVTTLDTGLINQIRASVEVTNEEPITGDTTTPNSTELKRRIYNQFASQNRAVTVQDYQALVYRMPPAFGAVKRVNVLRDPDSFKRNLNMYVISEDEDGRLTDTNIVVKENLRTWINKSKMLNDTIDILDAKIVNFGVDFTIVSDMEKDKYDVLSNCVTALTDLFSTLPDIGESLFITDIYSELKEVDGVVDVTRVKIKEKCGGLYSDIRFNVRENTSADGRYIEVPENVIMELKYPQSDIKGVVK